MLRDEIAMRTSRSTGLRWRQRTFCGFAMSSVDYSSAARRRTWRRRSGEIQKHADCSRRSSKGAMAGIRLLCLASSKIPSNPKGRSPSMTAMERPARSSISTASHPCSKPSASAANSPFCNRCDGTGRRGMESGETICTQAGNTSPEKRRSVEARWRNSSLTSGGARTV